MPIRHFSAKDGQQQRHQDDCSVFFERYRYRRGVLETGELKAHDDKECSAECDAAEQVLPARLSQLGETEYDEQKEGDRGSNAEQCELSHRLQQQLRNHVGRGSCYDEQ